MSADLLRKLRVLEEEYAGQPLVVQQADLREINRIRSQIGMPLVDARLNTIGTVKEKAQPKPKPQQVPDHTEARAIYQAYLKKIEELEVHRAYAERVVKATGGPGQTPVSPPGDHGNRRRPPPVRPLRQADRPGGRALPRGCCRRRLEAEPSRQLDLLDPGGHGRRNRDQRHAAIYHGYPGGDNKYCCNVASRNEEKAQAQFKSLKSPEKFNMIQAFLEHEFPDMTEKSTSICSTRS